MSPLGGGTTEYSNFADAWAAANQSGEATTIELLSDVNVFGSPLSPADNANITFIGGNHTLTQTGHLELFTISHPTGKLTIQSGNFKALQSDVIQVWGAQTLRIEGGTFITEGNDKHDIYFYYTNMSIQLVGGTFEFTEADGHYHGGIQCAEHWSVGSGLVTGYAFHIGENGKEVKTPYATLTGDQLHKRFVVKACNVHEYDAEYKCIYCKTAAVKTSWKLMYKAGGASQYSELPFLQQTNYKVVTVNIPTNQEVTFHLTDGSTNYGPATNNAEAYQQSNPKANGYQQNSNDFHITTSGRTTPQLTFVITKNNSVYVLPEEAFYSFTGTSSADISIPTLYDGQRVKVRFVDYKHVPVENHSVVNFDCHAKETLITVEFSGDNVIIGDNHGGLKIPNYTGDARFPLSIKLTSLGMSSIEFGSSRNTHNAIQDEEGHTKFLLDPQTMYLYFEGKKDISADYKEFVPMNLDEMVHDMENSYKRVKMQWASPYARSVNKNNYGTICLPYTTVKSNWSNIDNVYCISNITNDVVVLTEVDVMEKGKPYIFKPSESAGGDKIFIRRNDLDFTPTPGNVPIKDGSNDAFCGTYNKAYAPKGSYVLQNNIFKKVEADNSILLNYRAYLTLDRSAGQEAREFTLSFDDEPTSIDALNEVISGTATIYDLNGRKQNALRKGINIVNGKKIIVR